MPYWGERLMTQEPTFTFDTYHVFLVVAGAGFLLAYWIPSLRWKFLPTSAALIMIIGAVTFALVPGMPSPLDPRSDPHVWEVVSEFVVVIVLFATGLRIDRIRGYRRWQPTVRLLLLVMPLTIAAVAVLGWWLAGMTIGGAILLGAALAPTDPVLAGDLQVGPPQEGNEHPVRFALTAEAGLNDGLAFPFVYLGILVAVGGTDFGAWGVEWILRDCLYRIAVGVAGGAAVGWLLGKMLFAGREWHSLAQTGPGVIALGAVMLCYGAVELVEGYGFISVFVAGVVCRRAEEDHEVHRRLHAFSQAIEHALTTVLLFLLGGALPMLWPALDWRHSIIGFGLIAVIRPLVARLCLIGTRLPTTARWQVSFFGIRGVGSIYYAAYASGHVEFANEDQIWALIAFTIFASTVIHGLLVPFVTDRGSAPRAA